MSSLSLCVADADVGGWQCFQCSLAAPIRSRVQNQNRSPERGSFPTTHHRPFFTLRLFLRLSRTNINVFSSFFSATLQPARRTIVPVILPNQAIVERAWRFAKPIVCSYARVSFDWPEVVFALTSPFLLQNLRLLFVAYVLFCSRQNCFLFTWSADISILGQWQKYNRPQCRKTFCWKTNLIFIIFHENHYFKSLWILKFFDVWSILIYSIMVG